MDGCQWGVGAGLHATYRAKRRWNRCTGPTMRSNCIFSIVITLLFLEMFGIGMFWAGFSAGSDTNARNPLDDPPQNDRYRPSCLPSQECRYLLVKSETCARRDTAIAYRLHRIVCVPCPTANGTVLPKTSRVKDSDSQASRVNLCRGRPACPVQARILCRKIRWAYPPQEPIRR